MRAGNTLVGFTSLSALRQAMTITPEGQHRQVFPEDQAALDRIENEAAIASAVFDQFRDIQTANGTNVETFTTVKSDLREQLDTMREELNGYLASQCGVNVEDGVAHSRWLESHQPFHWFVEFYGIMQVGGFDVIIGNPPYVTYPSKHVPYSLEGLGYRTLATKNLYGLVFERCISLANLASPVGLIVQLTSLSSTKLPSLQNILLDRGLLHASAFPRRPQSIFEGVEMPVSILLSTPMPERRIFTTKICRFYTEEKAFFVEQMSYREHSVVIDGHRIAKFGQEIDTRIYRKIDSFASTIDSLASKTGEGILYYQEACRYWAKAANRRPFYKKNGVVAAPSHWRSIPTISEEAAAFVTCVLNSSLFYWYYSAFSDCEHVNDGLVRRFPIPDRWNRPEFDWKSLCSNLMDSLESNAKRKLINTRQGHTIEYDEISGAASKAWIDLIDEALAKIYGLSKRELDYILRFDIKYRAGFDAEAL